MKEQWECFRDVSYYDKWAVRNTADKSFNSAIHVETFEEAEFLTESLNKLDVYREALEFIEFSTHFRCETYNGKDCEPNTQEAYEESLKSIRETAEQALNTEVK